MTNPDLPAEWSAGQPEATLILLHGLGASGDDLYGLAEALQLENVRFLLPDAPLRPISMYEGYPMRAWFDLAGLDAGAQQDSFGLDQARAQVAAWIARENRRGIATPRIALAGFSQGAALALYSGLTLNLPLAGVAGLSGWLPRLTPATITPSVWTAHGEWDTVVPLSLSLASYAQQPQLGITPHVWPIGHEICAEEIVALRDWLRTTAWI